MIKSSIDNVKLSGYKSINGIDISFNPKLNIIIGKNAVGKTNFINFLYDSLKFKFANYINIDSSFILKSGENKYIFKFEKKTTIDFSEIDKINSEFYGEFSTNDVNEIFQINSDRQIFELEEKLASKSISIRPKLIRHGIPNTYDLINTPLNLDIVIEEKVTGDFYNLIARNLDTFSKDLFSNLLFLEFLDHKSISSMFENALDQNQYYKNKIREKLDSLLKNLQKILSDCSPIQDIRISKNFSVFFDNENGDVSIQNLYLEYFIDERWYKFKDLSDGTKRVFYILSEIFSNDLNNRHPRYKCLNLVMIEEPELGLHPFQLMKLMHFIKEKSREIQFIITTHSPIVLNFLEKDELDCIIIAEKDKGNSVFRKLTDEEKNKASLYMEDVDLSDYWIHSNLEKERL